MFKRLLVALDGSKSSWSACEYAFEFAQKLNLPLVGIHIIDKRLMEESLLEDLAGILGFTFYYGVSSKVKEFLESQADLILEEFLSLGRQKGIKTSSFQTVGIPHKEIVSQADAEDLLFLGKKGKRPVEAFLLGSTADTVVRSSPCPVFLSTEESRDLKRVCVAYDGKEMSKKSMKIALHMREIFGFELYALHVGDESIKDEVFKSADHYESLKGLPEERIVEYCKEKEVDLLIMGAFSKGRFKEFLFGSTTSFVVHHLDIPMLLVK